MNKTRKEFETLFDIPDFLNFDGEDYMYYDEDPVLIEQQENISALWTGFSRGYKSRDEEIKKLREALEEIRDYGHVETHEDGDNMKEIAREALREIE